MNSSPWTAFVERNRGEKVKRRRGQWEREKILREGKIGGGGKKYNKTSLFKTSQF